jgi:2-desacetyl-2-hydroxyethyl bacteriochlorophyllide A dehydrogenase
MKAAVFQGARRIEIEEVPDPEVEPEGIVLKVAAAGICGSDLHPYKLAQNKMIFGHEVSGEVVAVGAEVSGFKIGDRVAGVPARPCGECYWCRQKLLLHCPNLMLPPGRTLRGAMAEYVSIPYARWGDMEIAVRLPDNVSYEQGATVEPLGVAIFSIKAAAPQPDDTVVVLGAGTIGLAAVAALKAMGIRQVIVSGRRAGRLRLAKDLGADIVVDAARDDILPVVKEATEGRGADVVLECAGVQATWQQAIAMTHRFGKVVLVGIFEQPIDWNPNAAIVNNINLIGILGTDARASLDMIASGKADTMRLVTHQFPLARAQEAFEVALTAEDAVKVLLKP